MHKSVLLIRFLKGSYLTYITALLGVLGNVAVATIAPLLIRVTIDQILGDEPLQLPSLLLNLVNQYGGLEAIRGNLWVLLIIFVTLAALQGSFIFLRAKMAALTGENSARRMRNRLFDHIIRQPFDYHVKAQTGDLIQRCTSDIETAQRFVAHQSIESFSILIQISIVISIMLSLSARYTLITVLLVPIVLILTVRFFRSMMVVFLEADEAEGVMSTTLQESLTGIRVVKAFAAQEFEMEKFDGANQDHKNKIMQIVRLMANFWSATDFICLFQFVAVIIVGTWWVATGAITLGTMVAFSTYAGMLIWPIRGLGQMMGFMGQAFVALSRIQEILDFGQEDYDSGMKNLEFKGEIRFDDVHFGYSSGKPLLKGISFAVKPGTTTAILGSTGSGKSSLVHLLMRFYDYQKGSITIDGIELKEISRAWIRDAIGLVLQEPFLFSRTVDDNIRIGRPDASEDEVREAARLAWVDNAIESFENGYATMVGERGVTLSGGQRQRVAIARTLLRKAPVLIFDDSLSAVDTETDAAIRAALRKRNKKATTLIISHRITTLAEADQIIVLDKGYVVQKGSHEELIQEEGPYRRIWELQSSMEDIA